MLRSIDKSSVTCSRIGTVRLPLLIATCFVLAISTGTANGQKKQLLDHHYVRGPIRVFYTTEGDSAVPPADADRNGTPDHVEDVAKQIHAAHQLFCTTLKFPDPLKSERYKGVTCIEVGLRHRDQIGGGNGVAFDESQRARSIPEGKPTDRAIVMSIGVHVVPQKNVTPAHELFHLIQYGATYFKNKWFLEGQARWSEHGLGKDGLGDIKYSPRGPWPQKPPHLQQLVKMSYDSEFVLWNPISFKADARGSLTARQLGQELTSVKYSDGTPVIRDFELKGAKLMREVLIEMGKLDDVAFKNLGYEKWTEDNQRSERNNPYVYQAIMDALRQQSPPVGRFKAN